MCIRDRPSYGTKISASEAKPGDVFFYGSGRSISHVAIYIGNGQIVHASNKRDGLKVSDALIFVPYEGCALDECGNESPYRCV